MNLKFAKFQVKRLLRVIRCCTEKQWTKRFSVGRGTYGAPKIMYEDSSATLKVGAFCSIGAWVTIYLGGNHRVDWITTYPFSVFRDSAKHIKGHPATKGDVVIGNDVWIGLWWAPARL